MNRNQHITKSLESLLRVLSEGSQPIKAIFYKLAPGGYAADDRFMGVRVPILRKIADDYADLSLKELECLLDASFNEQRLVALLILMNRYQKGDFKTQQRLHEFYLKHLKRVNNWNLVDASAPILIGAHLLNANKKVLNTLARSQSLWERRIAIVATLYFIRNNQLTWTLRLSKILLEDSQDLIHKAVGWMLREVGKRDLKLLKDFLDQYALKMPRTMLRYAIEKFPEEQRQWYLGCKLWV